MARKRPRTSGRDALVRSAEFVGWALGGLEREIAETRARLAALNAQVAQLRARFGKRASSSEAAEASAPPNRRKRRRNMSAAARQRISDAMRKRWAERRKARK